MGKQSKAKPKNAPKTPPRAEKVLINDNNRYFCFRCQKEYRQQKGYFSPTHIFMYRGNNGYLPICKNCVGNMFMEYAEQYNNDLQAAMRRICQIFNVYYSEKLFSSTYVQGGVKNEFASRYFTKSNALGYIAKTYDDTIFEEAEKEKERKEKEAEEERQKALTLEVVEKPQNEESRVSEDMIRFWGAGLKEDDYLELQYRFDDWVSRNQCETKAQESLFQQMCFLEWRIAHDASQGMKIEGLTSAYNQLLGSANLKPSQKVSDAIASQNSFGTLIKMWEDKEPIPEPDPEWRDADGIGRYISIWFFGHLCKMLKLTNKYSRLYEEAVAQYRVERPDLMEYEDEEMIDEVLSKANPEPGKESKGGEKVAS